MCVCFTRSKFPFCVPWYLPLCVYMPPNFFLGSRPFQGSGDGRHHSFDNVWLWSISDHSVQMPPKWGKVRQCTSWKGVEAQLGSWTAMPVGTAVRKTCLVFYLNPRTLVNYQASQLAKPWLEVNKTCFFFFWNKLVYFFFTWTLSLLSSSKIFWHRRDRPVSPNVASFVLSQFYSLCANIAVL